MAKALELEIDIDAELASARVGAGLLTADEIEGAKAKARTKVEAERKKAALARIEAEETDRLKVEEGLVTGDEAKDEMVNITIDLPEYATDIKINMRPYWHGHTYLVPRHVADTLREQMAASNRHQMEIEGKGLARRLIETRPVSISQLTGVTNALRTAMI